MANRRAINTPEAPAAIGPYEQAVAVGGLVFLSGQIPLEADSGELTSPAFADQAAKVFDNLAAVAQAAGGSLEQIVKITLYLTDLSNFSTVNEIMAARFANSLPARAAVQVSALPRGAQIEADAILAL